VVIVYYLTWFGAVLAATFPFETFAVRSQPRFLDDYGILRQRNPNDFSSVYDAKVGD